MYWFIIYLAYICVSVWCVIISNYIPHAPPRSSHTYMYLWDLAIRTCIYAYHRAICYECGVITNHGNVLLLCQDNNINMIYPAIYTAITNI